MTHQMKVFLNLFQEMDSATMKLVLDYVYTGQVYLSEDTVQSLLSAANLFQVYVKIIHPNGLRKLCESFKRCAI